MKPLDDVTLVEFASNLGAAYAVMLLAEQGAHAVRIEPPAGDQLRGTPHFHVLNRSKQVLRLDPGTAAGSAAMRELVARADVVVSGLAPAATEARGLDYVSIRSINPGALVLTIPPLGTRGPDAELEAEEDLVAAIAGITGSQWARSGNPVALTFPAASYSAGVMGAIAVTAALIARGERGAGQAIEVSLLAGALSLQTGGVMRHEKMTSLYAGPQDPLGPIPCYRLFEASDGQYLFVACGNATFWNKLCLALDRADLVADPRFEGAPWGVPPQHWQTLKDILEPIFRTRMREQWLSLLREADVPCAPVLTRQEFIEDSQVRHLGMRREIEDPALGATVQLGVPVNLLSTPGEVVGPAPMASNANDAILRGLPSRANREPESRTGDAGEKGPLSGTLVLDFSSYIAGPYGPMILGQLGADVIKIESLEGDPFRHFGFGFLGWNQQKRGIALNLGSSEGRDIVMGLARQADVVVENLRPGRLARFGIGYEDLKAANPRLIYMSVNGFGNDGPQHNQPGFDPLLQARSGAMAAQGGHHGHPVYLTCAICDYGAAMLAALGCVLGLRTRQRTGRGDLGETTLLQAAMAFQAGEFVFYDGRPDLEDSVTEFRGPSALRRAYQCRDDQWLFLSAAVARHWEALRAAVPSLPAYTFEAAQSERPDGALAETLAAHFAPIARGDALDRLREAGVPAARVNRFPDLFGDPQVTANELIAELSHSQWGRVRQTGMLAKFSATPGRIDRAAPLIGEHTDEVLRSYLSYDPARIEDLRRRGVIR